MLNFLNPLFICGGFQKVWDVDDGQCLHSITEHGGSVKVCMSTSFY